MADNHLLTCKLRYILFTVLLIVFVGILKISAAGEMPYRSPRDVAYSPGGNLVAASDFTAGAVYFIDTAAKKVVRTVKLKGKPAGLAWSKSGKTVFVAECDAGTIAEVNPKSGKIVRRLAVGRMPLGIAIASKKNLLIACNSGKSTVSIVDLKSGKELARISVPRSPFSAAITPDESLAVVTNFLPADPSIGGVVSCKVSIIDLNKLKLEKNIRLQNGSILDRDVAISPDGKWAYTVHAVGRFTVPTTQLERGWVNTNALTIIDLNSQTVFATMLLDQVSQGASEPWGVQLSADGKTLWITLSGVHRLAKIDMAELQKLLSGNLEGHSRLAEMGSGYSGTRSIWYKISKDPTERESLINDLSALYIAEVITKPRLGAKGPQGIDISPDGKQLAVAAYYSGAVLFVDTATSKVQDVVSVGKNKKIDIVRRGEMIFHDATYCFQHWMSCSTCHPKDGRVDGLNWDLLNDGIGNPKNTKSLLLSDKTPPAMSTGVRSSMNVAAVAGFRHILFREPSKDETEAVQAYIRSLKPVQSPYRLPSGELTDLAKKGKTIFNSQKTGCIECHNGKYFTNKKMHNVGTRSEYDRVDMFDTPTLIGLWQSAPYLHDGSAVTVRDVLTTRNKNDKHGKTSKLSKKEIDALTEYLLSL